MSRVRAAWGGPHRAPWNRGLWVTAREQFEPVPLPDGFVVEERVLDGVVRRVAVHRGAGRPVVVVPGLYARLHERLFVAIAAHLASLGRPVLLLEDRLAAPTVTLAGPPTADPGAAGRQLAALGRSLARAPDVLALSAGLVSAWSAPGRWSRRVVGFSGVVAPAAAVQALRGRPWVHRHFARCHREAGLEPAWSFDAWLDLLASMPRLQPPDVPWLLIHAEDDPVVPVASLDGLDPARVLRLPDGGHLGFGVASGVEVYGAALGRDDV